MIFFGAVILRCFIVGFVVVTFVAVAAVFANQADNFRNG